MHRRTLTLGLGLTGLLAGLPSCRQATEPLALAYHPWSGYAPLHLLHQLKLLAPDVLRTLDTNSASESMALLRSGQVQAAALTLDEVLLARAQGVSLTVVALLDISAGADMVLGHPHLQNLSLLKGKRVGHETGAVGELMFHSLLSAAQLPPSAVTSVAVPVDDHESAWLSGKVDAVVTFEPAAGRLLKAGAVRLFDSRQLPKDLVIADVLAVLTPALDTQADHIRQLLQALFRAQNHLHTHLLDSQYRLAPWIGLPPAQVMSAFAGLRLTRWPENRSQLTGDPPPLARTAQSLAAFLQTQQLVSGPIPLDHIINGTLLPLEAAL